MAGVLQKLMRLNCVCGRETVTVGDRRFYVLSRLGEGGFSLVDLIEDCRTRELYALKRILCHSRDDEDVALNEVKFMNMFRHPNLVPCEVHDLKRLSPQNSAGAQSEVLIVMPFYKHGSVWEEIEISHKQGLQLPQQRILKILRGICDAVTALHQRQPSGLTHRDIKPHNVMLDNDGTPVLMDFGSVGSAQVSVTSSRQAQSLMDTAAERCTMPYRAPELFHIENGQTITEKIDIWSLGCTLYAMCFHLSPFDDVYQKGGSIALAALSGKIHVPNTHQYSPGLIDLMLNMLKVNPAERPSIETITTRVEAFQPLTPTRV